jgi:hypothetical protein
MTVIAQPHASLAGIPIPRTFDPSTGQPMPNYDPEPVFSSGGAPGDELSQYAQDQRNSYSAAHAELDAADEVDELRAELAALDWSPAQFHAYLQDRCPGLVATCSQHAYVHLDCLPDQPAVSEWREARARFPDNSPLRHVKAESWRELARLLETEWRARKGMGRAVPVVEVATA